MEKWEREAIGSFMFLAIRVGLVHGKIRAKNTIWVFNIAMV
jgi:hypothetical protein